MPTALSVWLRRSTWSVLVLALVTQAYAIIGAAYQMQLGNPSNATTTTSNHVNYLIQRDQYAMDYNDTTRQPNWVSWDLTTGDVGGSGRSSFTVDPGLPASFTVVGTGDYSGSGYDRGHLCPSADRTVDTANNKVVFYMSNMMPQAPDNNQGVWANFETYCRTLASQGNELLITCGPSNFSGSTIASGVAIPGYVWKFVLVVPTGSGMAIDRVTTATRVIAIRIPNIAGVRSDPWQDYVTSVAALEQSTGFTFLTNLPANVASVLRNVVDGAPTTGAPSITAQPASQTLALGSSVTFAVTATGNATLTYQWFKDDAPISNATGVTYSIASVQAADAGSYTVSVSNSVGTATSNDAVLSLTGVPPSIATSPTTQTVGAGSDVTFSVVANGSPTLTYQWRKGGAALTNSTTVAGATTAVLRLSNVQAGEAGNYDVVVANSVSSATSATAVLTVTSAGPTLTTAPVASTVAVGGTATFTVAAKGTAPLTYQWRKDGSALSGNASATTTTLTLTGVVAADAGSYDVVVANGVGPAVTSPAVLLTVTTAIGGQLSYLGGTVAQNFDTLPASGTFTFAANGPYALDAAPVSATGLAGWTMLKYAGTGAKVLFGPGTGSSNTGSLFAFGTGTAADRALGSVASGTTVSRFGLTLVNQSGQTITQFTLSYTGEQWRNGGNTATQRLTFDYLVGGTDLGTGTFVAASGLDFTSPVASATAAALDGNATANRAACSATVSGLAWAPGQTLVLRWTDANDSGNDHGLAIDDLSFTTPVAAPTAPYLLSTSPAANATGVAATTPLTVTFDQPVSVANGWFTLASAKQGALAATVTGGPTAFTLIPPAGWAGDDTITLTVVATKVTDARTLTLHAAADASASFTTAATLVRHTYDEWLTTAGLSGVASLPAADADRDGVPNQLEYMMGTNPVQASSRSLPVVVLAEGTLSLSFSHDRTASEGQPVVQVSPDLATWTPVTPVVSSTTATAETLTASVAAVGNARYFRVVSAGIATAPQGFLNYAVAGGGATTALTLPLDDLPVAVSGLAAGAISSVSGSVVTVSGAGWSAGALANPAAPWALRLTSGAASGRLLTISANTATTVTLGAVTLANLGVAAGDGFELVPLDTLASLLGAAGLTGAATAAQADVVQVRSGTVWLAYFFDTTRGYWRRTIGTVANCDNTVLRADSALLITRRGTPLTLTMTGRALAGDYRVPVNNAATTVLSTGFPVATTLGELAVQQRLAGWRSGTSASTADQVYLFNGTAWVGYVFSGASWQPLAGGPSSDSVAIAPGTPLMLSRPGTTVGTTDFVRSRLF